MWFCTDGHFHDGKLTPMYVTHKPGEEHAEWLKKKKENKKGKGNHRDKKEKDSSKSKSDTNNSLSLEQSLKSALLTKAGVSESQFDGLWKEAVEESGNA